MIKLRHILFCIALFWVGNGYAQNISFNSDGAKPDNSAMLDVSDTTRGMLVPRMTLIQRNLIADPATGLLIFQLDSDSGFYYNRGIPATPNWTRLKTEGDSSYWSKKDTNLYYNSGNVGIGIDSAQGLLHLYGKGSFGSGSRVVFGDDYHNQPSLGLNSFIGESGWDSNVDSDQLHYHGKFGHFFTTDGDTGIDDMDTSVTITADGRMVIGNNDFGHVFNSFKTTGNFLRIGTDSGQVGLWASNDSIFWAMFAEQKGGGLLEQGAMGLFLGSSGLAWTVTKEGNMGLGTTTPDSLFDVNGGAKINRLSINNNYTFPPGAPSTNQILKFDGTDLNWSSAGSAASPWNDPGTSINYTAGSVGIGTTIPRKELHVNGSIIAESSNLTGLPTGLTYALLTNNNGESLLSSSSGFKSELLKINGSTISFSSGISNFSNPTVMFIDTVGNVGIGTTTPNATLEVNGSVAQKISTLNIGTNNNINNLSVGTDSYLLRLTGANSAANISGIDATFNGHMIVLFNATGFAITMENDDNGSDAENRILLHNNADITLPSNSSLSLIYSSVDARWIGTGYY